MVRDSYRAAIEAWRIQYEQGLTAPNSWLAVVGLDWLQEGENTFGADRANQIILPAETTIARAGSFDVRQGIVTLHADRDAHVLLGQELVTAQIIPINEQGSSEP